MLRWINSNPLYRNSIIFFIGTIIAGVAGYVYQVVMGRMLSLQDFGSLATLANFFGILFVPATALGTVSVQVIVGLRTQQRFGAIHEFVRKLTYLFLSVSIAAVAVLVFVSPRLERWLHIDSHASFILYSSSIGIIFLLALFRAVFSAFGRFGALSVSNILEGALKCLLAIVFVSRSLGLPGAVAGPVCASLIVLGVVLWQIRVIAQHSPEPFAWEQLPRLFVVIIFWSLAMSALTSLDLIFVKHFLSPEETGLYAGMSLLGKVIYFSCASVAGVLFPMSTELFESGRHSEHRRLLQKALIVVLGIGLSGTALYALIPGVIVQTLFGTPFLPAAPLLIYFGVLATVISVNQLFATYFLSLKKRWFILILLLSSITEAVMIILFHSSIVVILRELISIFALLGILLWILFLRDTRRVTL